MNNKGLIIGIIVVVVAALIGGWWWMMSGANTGQISNNTNQTGTQNTNNAEGTLYVNFTDAAVNMGNVSTVNMTVDKVYVHSQTQGWVTVSTTPQTFSLLALKAAGKTAVMAKTNVKADTYDQVWFHMTAVAITETGKTAKQATLPSADFKMAGAVKVVNGASSTATLDVLADQSIYKTDKGEFIFAPVVEFEGRQSATVNVDADNMATITNGMVNSNTTAGMDINGEVKANFKLDLNSKIEINGGVISVKSVI